VVRRGEIPREYVYSSNAVRIALILLVGIVGVYWPRYVDYWLWRGLSDVAAPYAPLLPLAVSVVAALADSIGASVPPCRIDVRRVGRWAIVVAMVAAVSLWWLRVPQWLGDYSGFDRAELPWWDIEAAEPLGTFTSYYTLYWGHAIGLTHSTSVALVVVLFGASAVAAMFLWALTVAAEWPLAFVMLISSGFMVLLCGYPEKGTPKSLALICWYVYFTTRALKDRRTLWLVLSNLSLSLTALMHGSGLCWLPAHAWYIWRRSPWRRNVAGIATFLAPMVLIAWYATWGGGVIAGGRWGNVTAPWQWVKKYCISNCGYGFWSMEHFVDVLSCLLVLSPLAVLCLPEALVRARDVSERWLRLGALGWLFLSVTWFPVFGYTSDWDIFAGTPLVISYFGVQVGTRCMSPAAFRRLAFAWVAGSLLHTASWWRFFHLPL
jgi:hypothetical protein